LKAPANSRFSILPFFFSHLKTGVGEYEEASIQAITFFGKTHGMFSMKPPIM
jgi:hypothetical protein